MSWESPGTPDMHNNALRRIEELKAERDTLAECARDGCGHLRYHHRPTCTYSPMAHGGERRLCGCSDFVERGEV